MKKIILLCLLFLTLSARAEKNGYCKYGYLVVEEVVQSDGSSVYGLLYEGQRILSAAYRFDYNDKIHLMVMYNCQEVYVFYAFNHKPLVKHHFVTKQRKLPRVIYTPQEILKRVCYRLEIKGDSENVNGGIFSVIDGQACQLLFDPL